MIDIINEMLSFPFMVRAIVVGSLTSICASLLGVNLVLKRYSMIGDGLSHVGFGALAVALVAGQSPLPIAIAACVLAPPSWLFMWRCIAWSAFSSYPHSS